MLTADLMYFLNFFRVQMQHLLGEGAFGCVYYAELQPEAANDNSVPTPIAVKMLKGMNNHCCKN